MAVLNSQGGFVASETEASLVVGVLLVLIRFKVVKGIAKEFCRRRLPSSS